MKTLNLDRRDGKRGAQMPRLGSSRVARKVKKIEILGFQTSGSVCNLRIKFIACNCDKIVSVFVIRNELLIRMTIDC